VPADRRWSLGADSLIKNVHYNDIALISGKRVVRDGQAADCKWEISRLNWVVKEHEAKDIQQDVMIAMKVGEADICATRNEVLEAKVAKSDRLIVRWKRAFTVTLGVAAVTTLITVLK